RPEALREALAPQLPACIALVGCTTVPLGAPSLQSLVRAARYRVTVPWEGTAEAAQGRVEDFLAREHVPWRRVRRRKEETVDLRHLVLDMRVEDVSGGVCRLWMRLRAGARGSVRPEDVLAALAMPEADLMERLALELEGDALPQAEGDAIAAPPNR
ncbi:MAG: DUF2344 domain-containing protein, partial [Anaerolineae bacterium]|nr:DUF2344 domain-containing protein [Anaerolineae bacterium]